MTPPDDCSVATRFVVLPPPLFIILKLTVTVSFGSIAPFAPEQDSAPSVEPAAWINGTPVKQTGTFVVMAAVMLKFPVDVP